MEITSCGADLFLRDRDSHHYIPPNSEANTESVKPVHMLFSESSIKNVLTLISRSQETEGWKKTLPNNKEPRTRGSKKRKCN